MPKPFIVEKASEISMMILIVGIVLALIGAIGTMGDDLLGIGEWEVFMLMIGALLLIVGLIWTWSFWSKVSKFHSLLSEKRKAEFIRRLDDVEYLAWKLPLRYEMELADKKREMGFR